MRHPQPLRFLICVVYTPFIPRPGFVPAVCPVGEYGGHGGNTKLILPAIRNRQLSPTTATLILTTEALQRDGRASCQAVRVTRSASKIAVSGHKSPVPGRGPAHTHTHTQFKRTLSPQLAPPQGNAKGAAVLFPDDPRFLREQRGPARPRQMF